MGMIILKVKVSNVINYPNGKNKYNKPLISTSNRGMDFEEDINLTNQYYLDNNIAVVYKKPTPIKLVKMDYEKGKIVVENATHATIYRFKQTETEWNQTLSMTDFMMMRQNPENLYETEIIEQTPTYGVEYVKIFENFANHILNGEELFASMEDGLKEVQLANSIQLSGWTGLAIDHPSNSVEYDMLLEKKITEENR